MQIGCYKLKVAHCRMRGTALSALNLHKVVCMPKWFLKGCASERFVWACVQAPVRPTFPIIYATNNLKSPCIMLILISLSLSLCVFCPHQKQMSKWPTSINQSFSRVQLSVAPEPASPPDIRPSPPHPSAQTHGEQSERRNCDGRATCQNWACLYITLEVGDIELDVDHPSVVSGH